MGRILCTACMIAFLAAPAVAAEPPTIGQRLDSALGQLEALARSLAELVTRYGAPRVNERGDIVVPRLPAPPPEPGPDLRKT